MIGLLGGIGPYATMRYYEAIVAGHVARTGRTPELLLASLDFEHFTKLENEDDPAPLIGYLNQGIGRLAAGGATHVAMTANSPHVVLGALESPVPIVSIVDPVVDEVASGGFERVLLLGIGVTARSSMYPQRLAESGVETVTPSASEQAVIDGVVFGELGAGVRSEEALAVLRDIVHRQPCDAVILGCTELPLLVRPGDLEVPVVDSLRLHVDAILATIAPRTGSGRPAADVA